jgi:pyruvate dehydrogenase E1 component alpha subunit
MPVTALDSASTNPASTNPASTNPAAAGQAAAARPMEGGADPDAFALLDADGRLPDGTDPGLPDDALVEAYRWMVFSRLLDERATSLQRQGRIGTFSAVYGQEASVMGTAFALDPARDWIIPQYRETPAILRHGYPLTTYLLYLLGNPAGGQLPADVLVTPLQIALAAQLPHAAGLALGLKMQRLDGVVMTYCGDGASSEGDFHEACNLAGVTRAPVIFVLQNNGYAISTPRSQQTAAASFAARAPGYGFPGERVDGNDFLAVYQVARRAVERARAGQGPTLIETQTYRLHPHNTADDQSRYVPPEELAERRKADPLPRFHAYLASRDLISDEQVSRWHEEIGQELTEAVAAAEQHPRPTPGQLFDHVYARPPQRLLRQRAELSGGAEGGQA